MPKMTIILRVAPAAFKKVELRALFAYLKRIKLDLKNWANWPIINF
jgi:hypothetical protein